MKRVYSLPKGIEYIENEDYKGIDAIDFLSNSLQYDQIEIGYNDIEPKNGIEDRQERTEKAIACLCMILHEKGILTDNEVFQVVGLDDYQIKSRKLKIDE